MLQKSSNDVHMHLKKTYKSSTSQCNVKCLTIHTFVPLYHSIDLPQFLAQYEQLK